jgi:magnesium-transporting ATPase (P-type)
MEPIANIQKKKPYFKLKIVKLQAESPRGDLNNFEGYLKLQGVHKGKFTLTVTQMLPRGTTLANTEHIYGVVIYTGEETKIRKNSTSSIRTKAPSMEKIINWVVWLMFVFVISLTAITTIVGISWESVRLSNTSPVPSKENYHWYLIGPRKDYVAMFFSNLILYNNLIPLPLYVGMELVKIAQALFINFDLQMYDEATDTPAVPRTSALSEELGQVQYVFTDKTGTLTQNLMAFKKMSVAGQSYVHETSCSNVGGSLIRGASTNSDGLAGGSLSVFNQDCLPTWVLAKELKPDRNSRALFEVSDMQIQMNMHAKKHEFLLAMALCHTVVPDKRLPRKESQSNRRNNNYNSSGNTVNRQSSIKRPQAPLQRTQSTASNNSTHSPVQGIVISPEDAAIQYQSSSPDETALVSAARDMGFILRQRTLKRLTLNVLMSSPEETYNVLQTIEFSSNRKRMSVIYKFPDGRIMLLCKGADSVILERLQDPSTMTPEDLTILESTLEHLAEFASEGLRTLLYASRELSQGEYDEWAERYTQASMALAHRTELMEQVAEEIECDLRLLGATAIEDKLQEGVGDTIDKLRRTDMRLWMLTGDKKETAINIAYTCRLAKSGSEMLLISGKTLEAIGTSIDVALDRCRSSYREKMMKRKSSKNKSVTNLSATPSAETQGHAETKEKEKQQNPSTAVSMPPSEQESHCIVIIDGDALAQLEIEAEQLATSKECSTKSLLERFLEIGILSDSVICCRFSPSQKALIVSKVREMVTAPGFSEKRIAEGDNACIKKTWLECMQDRIHYNQYPSGVTLAIGDGANDIPMLQCAHVGIGITGREGLAASRASDYAIGQFRFLQQLLFVHGRYSYVRISLFSLGTFYKCFVFYLTQAWFQIWTGWSGTSIYEQWSLTLYNLIFTSLPVIVVGIFEKDLNQSTLLGVPELYRYGQFNSGFNTKVFIEWWARGVYHSFIPVILTFVLYNGFWYGNMLNVGSVTQVIPVNDYFGTAGGFWTSDASGAYDEASIYMLGNVVYTIVIMVVNLKVSYLGTHTWTAVTHYIFFLSIGAWWIFLYLYSPLWPALGFSVGYEMAGMARTLNQQMVYNWLLQGLAIVLCFGLYIILNLASFDWFGQVWEVTVPYRKPLEKQASNIAAKGITRINAPINPKAMNSKQFLDNMNKAEEFAAFSFKKFGHHADSIGYQTHWWQIWEKRNQICSEQKLDGPDVLLEKLRESAVLATTSDANTSAPKKRSTVRSQGSSHKSVSLQKVGTVKKEGIMRRESQRDRELGKPSSRPVTILIPTDGPQIIPDIPRSYSGSGRLQPELIPRKSIKRSVLDDDQQKP